MFAVIVVYMCMCVHMSVYACVLLCDGGGGGIEGHEFSKINAYILQVSLKHTQYPIPNTYITTFNSAHSRPPDRPPDRPRDRPPDRPPDRGNNNYTNIQLGNKFLIETAKLANANTVDTNTKK